MVIDIPESAKDVLRKRYEHKVTRECVVVCCKKKATAGKQHCYGHGIQYTAGFIVDNVPVMVKEKVLLSLNTVQDYLEELSTGKEETQDMKNDLLNNLVKLLSPTQLVGILDKRCYRMAHTGLTRDPDFVLAKQKARNRRKVEYHTRTILSGVPLEFQISRVCEEDNVLSITLGTRVDKGANEGTGYVDRTGYFLEKETLKAALENVFECGDVVTVTIPRRASPAAL